MCVRMRVLSVEATGVSLYFVSINLKGQVLIYVGVEGVSMVASEGPSKFVPCFPGLLWMFVCLFVCLLASMLVCLYACMLGFH